MDQWRMAVVCVCVCGCVCAYQPVWLCVSTVSHWSNILLARIRSTPSMGPPTSALAPPLRLKRPPEWSASAADLAFYLRGPSLQTFWICHDSNLFLFLKCGSSFPRNNRQQWLSVKWCTQAEPVQLKSGLWRVKPLFFSFLITAINLCHIHLFLGYHCVSDFIHSTGGRRLGNSSSSCHVVPLELQYTTTLYLTGVTRLLDNDKS